MPTYHCFANIRRNLALSASLPYAALVEAEHAAAAHTIFVERIEDAGMRTVGPVVLLNTAAGTGVSSTPPLLNPAAQES